MRQPVSVTAFLAPLAGALLLGSCRPAASGPTASLNARTISDSVAPNDNRRPAGRLRDGVLHVTLTAQTARWRPDANVDSMVTVQAFAGDDGIATVPGPLIRAAVGTEIRITLRNALTDSALIVHGLRPGSAGTNDTLHVGAGAVREVTFRPSQPGTYLYWGSRSPRNIGGRWGRDAQLTGAIIIDPAGARPDPAERIFVITLIDLDPEFPGRPPTKENVWEIAVNGKSWPHTERLRAGLGDTVRWRWINGTSRPHPIHLHGFHFRVRSHGSWHTDSVFAPGMQYDAVTQMLRVGQTFAMHWVPTRPGNWLVHCHMAAHISPYPERADSTRAHDGHDPSTHVMQAMAGLVMGITVDDRNGAGQRAAAVESRRPATQHLRLIAGQAGPHSRWVRRGFVLQRGADPAPDSVEVPGAPLILHRGERTTVTVVNRLSEFTAVHWHGMELQGQFDGVSGWSGFGKSTAPLMAPGDSFTVAFTPPRAGTFIYHTHMDEAQQLGNGMYGPMIVLEPGQQFDPSTDHPIVIGYTVVSDQHRPSINGRVRPDTMELTAGKTHRFRVINIGANHPLFVSLDSAAGGARWRMIAKDGADLPAARIREIAAPQNMGVGEAIDFLWTPSAAGHAVITVRIGNPAGAGADLRQPILVVQSVSSP